MTTLTPAAGLGMVLRMPPTPGTTAQADTLASALRARGHRVVADTAQGDEPHATLVVTTGDAGGLVARLRTQAPRDVLVAVGDGGVDACVAALDAGVDDYVRQPVQVAELESRIRALLRRRRPATPDAVERLHAGDIVVEPSSLAAWRAGSALRLTTGELRALEVLARVPNRVVGRDELHAAIGNGRRFMASRTVDVCIHSLREKVDRPFGRTSIETVRGVGYRLRVEEGTP